MTINCTVENVGEREGDEVLFVYHSLGEEARENAESLHPVPMKSLVNFERVSVPASGIGSLSFTIQKIDFGVVDENGKRQIYDGEHEIIIDNGRGLSQKIIKDF